MGYGAVGRLISGQPLPTDIEAQAARMVEESELVQGSSILLPKAMLGEVDAVKRGLAAYAPGLRLWDRAAVWDVCHVMPAIALTMLDKPDQLAGPLARLEECAAGGSRLAGAVLSAIRGEEESERDRGQPRHAELRDLGYLGISELLRYRAPHPS